MLILFLAYTNTETETDRLRNAAGEAFRKVLKVRSYFRFKILESIYLLPPRKEFIKAGRITILNNNVLTHEQIQELESSTLNELDSLSGPRMYMRLVCVWARRLSAPTASS
jgi:hypothetical protein